MDSEHLEAYLADELDANGRAQVEHALRNDAGLRERFRMQMQMDAALGILIGDGKEASTAAFNQSVIARLDSEGAGDARSFAKSVLTEIVEERKDVRVIRWPDVIKAGVISAAASIALMLTLQTIIFNDPDKPKRNSSRVGSGVPSFVARLESSSGVRWGNTTAEEMRDDGWLTNGLLELEAGKVVIAFNSGATAVVEGPASVGIESNNRIFLQKGKLTADVPPAATGFTVNTPRLNAVDIGTRFGISVDDNGDSELHVMEGEVEASRATGNAVATLVREGLALRADGRTRSELQPIPYRGDSFVLRLGEAVSSEPSLRYRFDESGGNLLEDSGFSRQYDTELLSSGEMENSPRRSAGNRGGGLVFQTGEFLSVPLSREFRLDAPHTISFWVKLTPEMFRNRNEQLLKLGREGAEWTLSCNFEEKRGSRGALMLETGSGHIIGTTEIADGKWHHVSYRFIGGEEVDIASHAHLFVDGIAEPVSDYREGKGPAGRAGELQIGAEDESGFHGWIDELTYFDDALSTKLLQQLSQ